MIVKNFIAKNVYGYLDFNIKFKNGISFLVGGNGSGKTTALKLMNALVTPSFKELLLIIYDRIELEIEFKGEKILITSETIGDEKTLKISSIGDVIVFRSYLDFEFDQFVRGSEKFDSVVETINREYSNHEIIQKITEIPTPIFLGLDRRNDIVADNSTDYYHEKERWLFESSKRARSARRLIKGSLGYSLMEIEFLVQSSYKRLRVLEERQSEKLRDEILASTFEYNGLDSLDLSMESINWSERTKLIKRKKEIKDALSKIGIKGSRLSKELDKFFENLDRLIGLLSDGDKGFHLEWLMNKAQIERISKIVDIIDEHKSKVDNLFKPINDFVSTINDFYSDSRKEIVIDPVGQIFFKRLNGDKCTIESLSSGERQLLVIFAHAFLNLGNKKNNVFIIDEPELSLHLRWQEKFSEIIEGLSTKSQFIMATHSPEIVGGLKSNVVKCR
ncbi:MULTISPECIES: AAA family ATPase [unclassified Endozoicomonas]|uniref:AAA family ATPase n=1 Tax=unclassified Endozoicomonas TaxID=2644528 RepID=UPI003BB81210